MTDQGFTKEQCKKVEDMFLTNDNLFIDDIINKTGIDYFTVMEIIVYLSSEDKIVYSFNGYRLVGKTKETNDIDNAVLQRYHDINDTESDKPEQKDFYDKLMETILKHGKKLTIPEQVEVMKIITLNLIRDSIELK